MTKFLHLYFTLFRTTEGKTFFKHRNDESKYEHFKLKILTLYS